MAKMKVGRAFLEQLLFQGLEDTPPNIVGVDWNPGDQTVIFRLEGSAVTGMNEINLEVRHERLVTRIREVK